MLLRFGLAKDSFTCSSPDKVAWNDCTSLKVGRYVKQEGEIPGCSKPLSQAGICSGKTLVGLRPSAGVWSPQFAFVGAVRTVDRGIRGSYRLNNTR
jgi:hypothetical protein